MVSSSTIRWAPATPSHRSADNLRRRQYRKLQTYDVIEIPPPPRPIPGGGDLAVRRIRAEQRRQWRLPGWGGRRYPEPRQRRALVRRDLQLRERFRSDVACRGKY